MKFSTSYCTRNATVIDSVTMSAMELKTTKVIRFPSEVDGKAITGVSITDPVKFGGKAVKIEFDEGIEFCEGFSESNITEVTFPRSMKKIYTKAFYGCQNLKKVNFPKDSELTMISKNAFEKSAVEEFILPASLERISFEAFRDISGLKRVSFEDGTCSLKIVAVNAFMSNKDLEYVEIPATNGFIQFAPYTFYDCRSLKEVVFKDNNVSAFSPYMFSTCKSLNKIKLPKSLRKVSKESFSFSGITSLDFSETSLEMIDDSAFAWSKIETIALPDTVSCICKRAFQFSKLKKIRLPVSLKRIEDEAFSKSNLSEIENIEQLGELASLGDGVFQSCDFTTLSIPDIKDVANTANDLFSNNKKLESVTFEEGVTNVSPDMFVGCTKLKSVKLSNTVKQIGYRAFIGCVELSSVEWNNALKSIGKDAFRKTAIAELILNAPELHIGHHTFIDCPNLNTVVLSPYAIYYSDSFPSEFEKKLESAKLF